MIAINKKRTVVAALTLVFFSYQPVTANISCEPMQSRWSDTELNAMAKTLAGECYDNKTLDKRRVCEVILNRVSNINFADTILEVLATPGAFNGYWRQSRPVSENDYAVAALKDWYEGGRKPLSEWLFFSKGQNHENVFRYNF